MITVIDLNIGNIENVMRAFKHVGAELHLTQDKDEILNANKLVLPGVGSFGAGMQSIHQKGLFDVIRTAALEKKVPILGICMGMQLFASRGMENGEHQGLGLLEGASVRIFDREKCKVIPHMGWNNVEETQGNPLMNELPSNPDFYFVHSYHVVDVPKNVVVNCTEYGESFMAAFAWENLFGVQFHPEKSQANGLKLLKNYLTL